MAIRETCVLCNQPPYTDPSGKKWDLCRAHCEQTWGGSRPPKRSSRRGLRTRSAAHPIEGLPPASPDPGDSTHPVELVLFDLNSGGAQAYTCRPIPGRYVLARDTTTLKQQIQSAFQAGYVLAWRMIPNIKAEGEHVEV